jgi:hypothetical protein
MRNRCILAASAFLLLCVFALPVLAADLPKWTRISITDDAATTMTISWNTTGNVGGEVQYGFTTQYGLSKQAPAAVQTAFGWMRSVVLTDLEPSRTYHYKVGSAADGWSKDFTFVTAPAGQCVPFSFAGGGDGRSSTSGAASEWANVLGQAAGEDPTFILYGGDWVEDGGQASQWNDFLNKSAEHLPLIPLMGVLGNHDDGPGEGDGAHFNQIFAYPRNNPDNVEDYYSFDYGSVHVVGISTESFKASNYASQAAWLDADLAQNDRIWTVVQLHRPPYSSGNHGSDEGGIDPVLVGIFDKHHVDIVLGGHDHDYERFKPMKGGSEVSSYEQGTLYIVSGGYGAPTDPIFPFRPKLPTSAKTDNKNHYVLFSVDGLNVHVKAVRVPGGLQGGTGVIEEFDLSKTVSPDPCLAPPDAGTPDTGTPDTGTPDAGTPDTGTPDASEPDAGPGDAGTTPDTGIADTGSNPPDASDPSDVSDLSDASAADTGTDALFADARDASDLSDLSDLPDAASDATVADSATDDSGQTGDGGPEDRGMKDEGTRDAAQTDGGTADASSPAGDRGWLGGADDSDPASGADAESGCSCAQIRL